MVDETKPKPRPIVLPPKPAILVNARLQPVGHWWTTYQATVDRGTAPETLLQSGFWAGVSARLKPFDRIEIKPVDDAYFAEILVRDAGQNWAKVEFLPGYPLMLTELAEPEQVPDGYKTQWRGPHSRFAAVRVSDKAVLKEGFRTSLEAAQWLVSHVAAGRKAA